MKKENQIGLMKNNFNKILVANRSEIAVRVIKSIKNRGLQSVAIFAEGDEDSNHVHLADEALCVGPAKVSESYLNIKNILEIAKSVNVDAIHPGYGFLSENANFAKECESANICFIGPSPEIIKLMGNKAEAKRKMMDMGVPCIPGYQSADQSDKSLIKSAKEIGFPIMIKASAGGGGKGMRLIGNIKDIEGALSTARSEAFRSFGSDELILEKALEKPLHIEVQVFGDKHGNYVHMGERDCSIQRRHQKVIEETPGPSISSDLQELIRSTSVEIIRNIEYVGAGTIEFLVDGDEFYFLEMNTRIQVEHAVTEMVTGLDLVAMQIDTAEGKPLGIKQDEINLNGHAIEARLYAENPSNGFIPSPGDVYLWKPYEADGIRIDHSLSNNQSISRLYDPMIAKVIAWGQNRETSRKRLIKALNKSVFFGTDNNKHFLKSVLESKEFIKANINTNFLSTDFHYTDTSEDKKLQFAPLVASFQYLKDRKRLYKKSLLPNDGLLNWRSSGNLISKYKYKIGEQSYDYLVCPLNDQTMHVTSNEEKIEVSFIDSNEYNYQISINDTKFSCDLLDVSERVCFLQFEGVTCCFENLITVKQNQNNFADENSVKPPMHGNIYKILVKVGDKVKKDKPLIIVESMKMEHEILAPSDGIVENINVKIGEQVSTDTELISMTGVK
ncbi:MAG: biotin carboxylase N-terminal domain-containing protein [Pseudomonadota bacterium]|nr:biotin carboxylase N-terminal domain-containing protein [Pseudomonadota bacterium]